MTGGHLTSLLTAGKPNVRLTRLLAGRALNGSCTLRRLLGRRTRAGARWW